MFEMQTPPATKAPAAQEAPATTQLAPADAPALPGQSPIARVDLSKYTAGQLRRMLEELRNQRQQLASRREGISGNYENATGANQEGIGQRLRVLDQTIIDYETEIARVGRELAIKGGGSVVEQSFSGQIPPGYMAEDEAAGMTFGFSFMTAVLVFFFTRRFLRKRYAAFPQGKHQPGQIASNERLDRIEQAVDTIAVEIERVSENQRFMTRLMTETQLGDTIKDVRKSAELAKSAAESG